MSKHRIFVAVPTLLTCQDCGLALLGFEARGPTPINHEKCPDCGGKEFAYDAGAE